MKPLYKIRDKVLIKKELDPGTNPEDYRGGFIDFMRERFGGKIYEIIEIQPPTLPEGRLFSDDGYIYKLKGDKFSLIWASSMFEPEF